MLCRFLLACLLIDLKSSMYFLFVFQTLVWELEKEWSWQETNLMVISERGKTSWNIINKMSLCKSKCKMEVLSSFTLHCYRMFLIAWNVLFILKFLCFTFFWFLNTRQYKKYRKHDIKFARDVCIQWERKWEVLVQM